MTGGLKPTGGYTVEVPSVNRTDANWLIDVAVLAPAPDAMVTTALTNPIGFFKLPKLEGEIKINMLASEAPTAEENSAATEDGSVYVSTRWNEDGMLNITGAAYLPDLEFTLMAGDVELGRADAQVKDSAYVANIIVPDSTVEGMMLVVTDPATAKEILRLAVPANTSGAEENS